MERVVKVGMQLDPSKLQTDLKKLKGDINKSMGNIKVGFDTSSMKGIANQMKGVGNQAGNQFAIGFQRSIGSIGKDILGSIGNAMKSGVKDAIGFNNALESSTISLGLIAGDLGKANQLTDQLRKHSRELGVGFEGAAEGLKVMANYGVPLETAEKSLKGMMGVAMSSKNGAQSFESIGRALGQIQSKGKLAAEELNQLTNAGVNVTPILNALGVTRDSLKKTAVSADDAVSEIVNQLNAKYGPAAEMLANTTKGAFSSVKNGLIELTSISLSPLTDMFRNTLIGMRESLNGFINSVRENGLGNAMREMLPPDVVNTIYLTANAFGQIATMMAHVAMMAAPLLQVLVNVASTFMGVVGPAINWVVGGLSNFLNTSIAGVSVVEGLSMALAMCAGVFVAFKVQALATAAIASLVGVFTAIGKALATVRISLALTGSAMATFKIIAGGVVGLLPNIALIATGVAAGAVAFSAMSKSVSGADSSTSSMLDTLGKAKPVTDAQNQSFKQLGQTTGKAANNTDKLTDKLKKTGKQAKKTGKELKESIMSFDEVFTIDDKKLDSTTQLPDVPKPSIPSGGGGGGIPMPPLSMPSVPGGWGGDIQNQINEQLAPVEYPSSMVQEWRQIWERIKDVAARIWEGVGGIFSHGWDIIRGLFSRNTGAVAKGWALLMSDLRGDTTKGINLLEKTTHSGLSDVIKTWDLAIGSLPEITEDNIGAAAALFAGNLEGMDEKSLTILRGTSDSMAHLFHGIRTDMEQPEAMQIFARNIAQMQKSGTLSGTKLKDDLSKAMEIINKNVRTYAERTRDDGSNLLGALASNASKSADKMAHEVSDSAKEMNKDSIQEVKDMDIGISKLFDGIEANSDFTSQATKDKVTKNIEQMKRDGTLNVDGMKKEFEKKLGEIERNSAKQMKAVKDHVAGETFDASVFAGTNARQIEENIDAQLNKIPGKSRDDLNAAKRQMVNELVDAKHLTKDQAKAMVDGIGKESSKTSGKIKDAMISAKNWLAKNRDVLEPVTAEIGRVMGDTLTSAFTRFLKSTILSPSWMLKTIGSKLKESFQGVLDNFTNEKLLEMMGKGRSVGGRSMGVSSRMANNVMGMGARNNYNGMHKQISRGFNEAISGANEAGVLGSGGTNIYYNVTVEASGLRGSDQASLDRMARELKVAFEREDNRTFSGSNSRVGGGIIYG